MVTLVAFLSVLMLLVFAHELGHFITAKLAGVVVQEFGFGYPPRIFAVKWRGTEYSLNLLPLGGFVKLLGEEDPKEPGSLAGKGVRDRLIILGAGSFMNAILPVALFTISLMLPKDTVTGQVKVLQVISESPADMAGIREEDIILKINDRPIQSTRDVGYNIQLNLGSEMEMVLKRGRFEQLEVRVIPRWNPPHGQGATGIVITMASAYNTVESYPPWEAFPMGVRNSLDMLTLFKNGIISLFFTRSGPAVTGPIGIAQITGEVAQSGIPPLMEWAAFLSMNLAIMNILPIPMLDGGRMFFVLLEWVRGGKRVPPEREGLVHLVGFVLLMIFVIIVSYFDIARIISGESVFR